MLCNVDLFDRRSSKRILPESKILIQCLNLKNKEYFSSSIEDLSIDGMCLKTNESDLRVKLGDKLQAEVTDFKKQSGKMNLSICWNKKNEDGSMFLGVSIQQASFSYKTKVLEELDIIKKIKKERRVEEIYQNLYQQRQADSVKQRFLNFPEYKRKKITSHQAEKRREKPIFNRKYGFFLQSIISFFAVFRDLFIQLIPQSIVRIMFRTGTFAFIAHPRDFSDVSRMFPFSKFIPVSWVQFWFKYQWPFSASRIIRKNSLTGKVEQGWLLICPLWAEDMMRNNNLARKKIIETAKFAEKMGCKVVGLGAFTSIVTHDGKDVIEHVNCSVTTGNALSAAAAISNLKLAAELTGRNLNNMKVAVVGAGGSVGSGCASALALVVDELFLIDINQRSLSNLNDKIKKIIMSQGAKTKVLLFSNLERLIDCDGIIVVTNAISTIVDEKNLKSGAIVIDCAQPKNVSKNLPTLRKDVLVIESAIVKIPGLVCEFDLDIDREESLGCMAESLLLTTVGKKYMLDKVTIEQIINTTQLASKLGVNLGYFRNSNGFITEEQIDYIKNLLRST